MSINEEDLLAMFDQKEIMINGVKTSIPILSNKCKVVYHPFHESLAEAKFREGVPLTYDEKRQLGL